MKRRDPMERCGAKTHSGGSCRHEAGWGTLHVGVGRCKLHGGSTPYGQANGVIELARREQVAMGAPITIAPQAAILECIAIAAGEVSYASEMVAGLEEHQVVGPVTARTVRRSGSGASDEGEKSEPTSLEELRYGPPALHVWIQVRDRALDRLMTYTTAALKLNIEERLVRVAEGQAALLAQAVKGILTDLGVQDHPEAPQVVRRHLTLLAGGSFLLAADLLDPPRSEHEELAERPTALEFKLEPHQLPPPGQPGLDWFVWLLLGGRGAGKTQAGAAYMHAHALGPPCLPGPMPHRMAIVAPTLGDASESCVNGPSGLRAHSPAIVETTRRGGTFVNWPNGAQARLFGAYTREEPERLRAGGNRCLVWMEEVAAWRYLADCWKHIQLGLLRLGPAPHAIASTTPRNRPTMRQLIALATASRSLSHATTADNPHLPEQRRKALYAEYGGTRVGRQELEGEMIEEVEGALWSADQLEACRIAPRDVPSERIRLVIAVDPSWGTTNDEVGIVCGFRGPDERAYILEDLSGMMTPSEWGVRIAKAYERLEADNVIAEGNFQAEQVRLVMKVAQSETGIRVNFKLVHASRGKVLRAEPVVALYEQGRVRHVGYHVGLEHQMTHWVPPRNAPDGDGDKGDPEPVADTELSEEPLPSDYSPDRVDALVFLVTDLLLGTGGPGSMHAPAREPSSTRPVPGRGSPLLGARQRALTERQLRRG